MSRWRSRGKRYSAARNSISATRRSSGVVTLRFSRGAGTTRTVPPSASTSDGVVGGRAERRRRPGRARARARRGGRPAASGPPTARERSSVRDDAPVRRHSLIVSVTGAAAIAASASRPARRAQRLRRARASPAGARRRGRRPTSPSPARRRARRAPSASARAARARRCVPAGARDARRQRDDDLARPRPPRAARRRDHSSIGRPASATNALGPAAPRRSPRPAATTARPPRCALLRGGDLRRPADSASRSSRCSSASSSSFSSAYISSEARIFLARVNICFSPVDRPFSMLADREVADDLGELVDVAGLDLVAVVLEPAVPVLGHLRDVVLQHGEHLLDGLLVDHAAQAGQRRRSRTGP